MTRRFSHRFIFIILLSALIGQSLAQQSHGSPRELTDSLSALAVKIMNGSTSMEKYQASDLFGKLLGSMLKDDYRGQLKFDSVPLLSVLSPPDKRFRIFTWCVYPAGGTYEYFGYLQLFRSGENGYRLFELKDKSAEIKNPETSLLDEKNWYGALYYKVIRTKSNGRTYYALLGWDGNDYITARKVIEVLSFKSGEKPVFGGAIFRKYKDKAVRVLFEYSAKSSFSLRYEKQFLHAIRKTKKGKKDVMKKQNMIIFDLLSPVDPRTSKYSANLEGQYQFYVPETNIFDAFIFINGKWVYTRDVDARNPKKKPVSKKDLPKPEDYFDE